MSDSYRNRLLVSDVERKHCDEVGVLRLKLFQAISLVGVAASADDFVASLRKHTKQRATTYQ